MRFPHSPTNVGWSTASGPSILTKFFASLNYCKALISSALYRSSYILPCGTLRTRSSPYSMTPTVSGRSYATSSRALSTCIFQVMLTCFSIWGCIHFYQELCERLNLEPVESTRDGFVDVLAQLICNGSGIHEHVGQVSDYMQKPDFLGCKLPAR